MVVSLTTYACFADIDYTNFLVYMFFGSLVLLAASISLMFVRIPILHTVIAAISVIFFGVYLIIDTQLIIGGKRFELEMDDYVIGAMLIYVDIIAIFLEILKLIGSKN